MLPVASAYTGNDMFANGQGNSDDFRTASIGGHVRLGHAVLAVDAAMLTDRGAGTRSDETLAVGGWTWGPDRPALGWHAGGFFGGGVRIDGNQYGAEVQNSVHRTIGVEEVHLAYDLAGHGYAVRPAVTASAAAGWLGPAGLGLTGWWGFQVVAAGQGAIGGEAVGEIGPRLTLLGQQGAFWLGPRLRLRDGEPTTTTVAATGDHEDGWWLESGTYVTPFGQRGDAWGYQVRIALNPETRAALGSLGVVVRPQAAPSGQELAFEHDLAAYRGGGLGVQLRWYPWPYQDTGRRSGAVFDYRFGTEPGGRLRLDQVVGAAPVGADIRHDQFTVGWEEGVRSPSWSGVRFVPWVQAGAGVRQEGMMVEGSGAHHLDGHATTAVLRGATGVRIDLGERCSLGFSLDGWLPAWSEELRGSGECVTLNDPGWTFGAHVAAHMAW